VADSTSLINLFGVNHFVQITRKRVFSLTPLSDHYCGRLSPEPKSPLFGPLSSIVMAEFLDPKDRQ